MTTDTRAKGRPILFSGPMVLALLNGTKTQTRRVVKDPVTPETERVEWNDAEQAFVPWRPSFHYGHARSGRPIFCPYGAVGDRLWVRETWRAWATVGAGDNWKRCGTR